MNIKNGKQYVWTSVYLNNRSTCTSTAQKLLAEWDLKEYDGKYA